MAAGEPEKEILSWPAFGDACRDLSRTVAASGYQPEIILGIARGVAARTP